MIVDERRICSPHDNRRYSVNSSAESSTGVVNHFGISSPLDTRRARTHGTSISGGAIPAEARETVPSNSRVQRSKSTAPSNSKGAVAIEGGCTAEGEAGPNVYKNGTR